MFHVLGLFGFNHSNNSNQVKKVCLWSNPRLPFGAFRRKGNRKLWSVLGPVGWSGACVPAAPPKRWHNFSKNWKSSENTSHQEPGHLGLNSSTPTEPEILGLLQLLLRRLTKPSRITALLQALPQTPPAAKVSQNVIVWKDPSVTIREPRQPVFTSWAKEEIGATFHTSWLTG